MAESLLARMADAARDRKPWLRVTASPRLARFLIAAGARPAVPRDDFAVGLRDVLDWLAPVRQARLQSRQIYGIQRYQMQVSRERRGVDPRIIAAARVAQDDLLESARDRLLDLMPDIRNTGFTQENYRLNPEWTRAILHARSILIARLRISAPASFSDLLTNRYQGQMEDLIDAIGYALVDDTLRRVIGDSQYHALVVIMESQPDGHWPDIIMAIGQAIAVAIDEIARPADVSGLDLSDLILDRWDLTGITWSQNTKWPQGEISEYVQTASVEISEGVYRVSRGGEQRRSRASAR